MTTTPVPTPGEDFMSTGEPGQELAVEQVSDVETPDQWWQVIWSSKKARVGVIVLAVYVYLRSRRTQVSQAQDRRMSMQEQGRAQSPAEEITQREEHRLGGMSAEDRAWETASLERN